MVTNATQSVCEYRDITPTSHSSFCLLPANTTKGRPRHRQLVVGCNAALITCEARLITIFPARNNIDLIPRMIIVIGYMLFRVLPLKFDLLLSLLLHNIK